jgi:regulator of protease activity HflC (stomatin/prohibitin superfamily)
MVRERELKTVSGYPVLFVLLAALAGTIYWIVTAAKSSHPVMGVIGVLSMFVVLFLMAGLFVLNPNEGAVAQLFGSYVGTSKTAGLRWMSPFFTRRTLSLRIRNFESAKLKVNDSIGNPIEIGAIVVWRVVDTAEAMFEVDSYENFIKVQTEAAVRNLATTHPYDSHAEGEPSLRANPAEIAEQLKVEVQTRLSKAGVEVIEARISHLAYAPEIASAMLQRQQATAIIAARQKIVEGAVGMVEMALDKLSERKVVELDEERKAAMVSNLLVVLCSNAHTQPVVNTGTLYT